MNPANQVSQTSQVNPVDQGNQEEANELNRLKAIERAKIKYPGLTVQIPESVKHGKTVSGQVFTLKMSKSGKYIETDKKIGNFSPTVRSRPLNDQEEQSIRVSPTVHQTSRSKREWF